MVLEIPRLSANKFVLFLGNTLYFHTILGSKGIVPTGGYPSTASLSEYTDSTHRIALLDGLDLVWSCRIEMSNLIVNI